MFSRRKFVSILSVLGLSGVFLKNIPAQKNEVKTKLPPHNDALLLVWATQQKLISEIEIKHAKTEQRKQKEYISAESRWWFDIDNRQWKVQRIAPPGVLDTTHDFIVLYLINGKEVARWAVDTEKKIVD